ncbi:MAG: hypothetical protein B1H40_01275 [Candidatus Latescibacteria bacterium 4484_181]|nr:MAG: hypothetical protein B1H40_01275 [Candidatus Latescibacteria bacterium 4484_181]RKY68893.1 MAG: glycosyltransferase family 9 protein [Candidatus Latescibacterota bacterium]RKY72239.1 MAG: glycosyltransferase family 9 protein [Candidatus Latescibacterota bacterium]HDN67487.1 glycosyltransferase family 9 protein [Bacillota bacterium]
MRILVISLAGIGNTLLSTPAVRLLRETFPEAHIAALVMFKGARELLETNPYIDEVLYWDFLNRNPIRSLNFLFYLRKRKFDVSLNAYPANRREYNLISFLIGAKKRLGHRYNHQDSLNFNFLNNRTIHEEDERHDIEENIALVQVLGCKGREGRGGEIWLADADRRFAEEWLSKEKLEDGLLIGFHPGTARFKNQQRRRWAKEKFAQLADILSKRYKAKTIIFGGPDEIQLAEEILALMECKGYLAKGITLRQTAALIERCDLFVSNDSGLMHVAAALKVPVVAIFGPTNPVWVRPYCTKYTIVRKELPCSPCFFYSPQPLSCRRGDFACIDQIDVEDVLNGVMKLMKSEGLVT